MSPGSIPLGKTMFRIREAADIVGVKPYVLRFWETQFAWIQPERDTSGQRRYTRRNLEDILVIRSMLREERYTIAGVRQMLVEARRTGHLEDLRKPQRAVLKQHDDRMMLLNLKKELQRLLKRVQ